MTPVQKRYLLMKPPTAVLDHGFVRLVDFMGDDSRIVQAARVSTGQGTKTPEEDRKLIWYMMRNRHSSPFEKVLFELHCKHPIFVARQWIRHRTASVNERSGRYGELPEEFYVPSRLRKQSSGNKQMSGDLVDDVTSESFKLDIERHCKAAFELYHRMLAAGIARELARLVLPVNTYTDWYWTMDLHNLFHFLELRLHPHAQWEFQRYALAIVELIKPVVPVAWEAFEELRLKPLLAKGSS